MEIKIYKPNNTYNFDMKKVKSYIEKSFDIFDININENIIEIEHKDLLITINNYGQVTMYSYGDFNYLSLSFLLSRIETILNLFENNFKFNINQ